MFDKIAFAGVVVMVTACGSTLSSMPGRGETPWIELTSEHFTLWTDTAPEHARELIRKMERFRQIALGAVFGGAPESERHVVVAVRDREELRPLWSPPRPASFTDVVGGPLPSISVFAEHSHDGDEDESIAHELTHLISGRVVRAQPRWLAEGMAEYFETVDLDPDGPVAKLGLAPFMGPRPARKAPLLPIAELLTWDREPVIETRHYSTAWALFTFLINEHRPELARYFELLDAPGVAGETGAMRAERIWRATFPSLPLASVDGELRRWISSGRHVVTRVNVQLRPWPVVERALSDADVFAMFGRLFLARDRTGPAHEAITAGLASDATHVLAWLVRVALDQNAITLDQGRAIAAVHRDDWRAWFLAAHAVERARGDATELQQAIDHACRLGGRDAMRGTAWSCALTAADDADGSAAGSRRRGRRYRR